MAMLGFFPWLRLKVPVRFAEYELLPFVVGDSQGWAPLDVRDTIESVLQPFQELKGRPIDRATVVRTDGRDILSDLDDQEREDLFTVAEVIAFSGLSARKYFSHDYWNRDNFRLVVQSFSDATSGVTVVSRRRDGRTMSHRTRDVLEIRRPDHVYSLGDVTLDDRLLTAIEAARLSAKWPDLEDSITCFNLANTDAEYTSDGIEAVLLVAAFERLLGCRSGSEGDLANAFVRKTVPKFQFDLEPWLLTRAASGRLPKFTKSDDVRDVWIRDFFRLRGNFAHGQNKPRYRPVWPLWAHLLLGSFVFPLVMKSVLVEMGLYENKFHDRAEVDAFEALAAQLPIEQIPRDSEHPWHLILGENYLRVRREESLRAAGLSTSEIPEV